MNMQECPTYIKDQDLFANPSKGYKGYKEAEYVDFMKRKSTLRKERCWAPTDDSMRLEQV